MVKIHKYPCNFILYSKKLKALYLKKPKNMVSSLPSLRFSLSDLMSFWRRCSYLFFEKASMSPIYF